MQTNEKTKGVLILSGGLDSTVLLSWLLDNNVDVAECLTFYYGQQHHREVTSAIKVAGYNNIRHKVVNLREAFDLFTGSNRLQGLGGIPEGHYAAETMKATVVPNRNMIFLSIAVGRAATIGANTVYTAVHAGDHAIYPDCRPEFIGALGRAIEYATNWTPVRLQAPFKYCTKEEIVAHGSRLASPMHLTWSCYKGGVTACGRCGTCVERLEAFNAARVEDPIPYEDREFWKTAVAAR